MDFDQYVAARYGRLIEHAVLLGCAEGEAGTHVDRVLLEQRKQIRRAEDPDPLVHEALERSISGRPAPSRRTGPLTALALVGVTVAVAVALTYHPSPRPMPSLFALDGSQAQRLLEDQGYDVVLRPARACEPQGLVLSSDPQTGALVSKGDTVTVRTAVPSDDFCQEAGVTRSEAWQFVSFALGGPAPALAPDVRLVVDGAAQTTTPRDQIATSPAWRAVFDQVATAAHQSAPTTSGMPTLRVVWRVPPDLWCAVRRPAVTEGRVALRFEVDTRNPDDTDGCPLTVDLYRSDDAIDTVVVYSPQQVGSSDGLSVDPTGLRPGVGPARGLY